MESIKIDVTININIIIGDIQNSAIFQGSDGNAVTVENGEEYPK